MSKGFTLIELIVVITILIILAIMGLAFFNGQQKSARDSKRLEDLRAIRSALEVYYSNHNNSYPPAAGAVWSYNPSGSSCPGSTTTDLTFWTNALGGASGFSGGAPIDPINNCINTFSYSYVYNYTGGTWPPYTICVWQFETTQNPAPELCLKPLQ